MNWPVGFLFLSKRFEQGDKTNGKCAARAVQRNGTPHRMGPGDSRVRWAEAEPPEGPRSREYLYPAGSSSGVFAARDALFHRQRFFSDAAAGGECVLSRTYSISPPPCGYQRQRCSL